MTTNNHRRAQSLPTATSRPDGAADTRVRSFSAWRCSGELALLLAACAPTPSASPAPIQLAATRPTPSEVLERFGATQKAIREKFKSYSMVTETVFLDDPVTFKGGVKIPLKGIPPQVEEFRRDANRFFVSELTPSVMYMPDVYVPGDQRNRTWVWDGERYYFYTQFSPEYAALFTRKHPKSPSQFAGENREKGWGTVEIYADLKHKTTRNWISGRRPALGQVEEYERLRSAEHLTLGTGPQTVAGATCYLLEARTKDTTNRVWLDPIRGYQILKQEIIEHGKPAYAVWDVLCEQVEELWFPMEKKWQYLNTHGGWTENRQHYKVVKLVLNPDHEALRSFVLQPREYSFVQIHGAEGVDASGVYFWKGGTVQAKDGRVILKSAVR